MTGAREARTSPHLRRDDPLITAVLDARTKLNEAEAAYPEPSQRVQHAWYAIEDRKLEAARLVSALRDWMGTLERPQDQTRGVRQRLEEARKAEERAYRRLIEMHVEHWQLTGRLPDYVIDPEMQATLAAPARR